LSIQGEAGRTASFPRIGKISPIVYLGEILAKEIFIREKDVRDFGHIKSHHQHHRRAYQPYATSSGTFELINSVPYPTVYRNFPAVDQYSFPTSALTPQPLVDLEDSVSAMGSNLRAMNHQYWDILQSISRMASATSYSQLGRYLR
jgi:hypothetical protein